MYGKKFKWERIGWGGGENHYAVSGVVRSGANDHCGGLGGIIASGWGGRSLCRAQAGVVGGHGGEPWVSDALAGPPEMLWITGQRELVAIQDCANITGRLVGKGITGEQAERRRIIVQEFGDQGQGPGIFVGGRHSGEPHLPVEAKMVGGHLRGSFVRRNRKSFIWIFFPVGFVIGYRIGSAFEHDIQSFGAHRTECAISIDEIERIVGGIHDLIGGEDIESRLYAQ